MFWADKLAKEIIESGQYKPYWVDDMKTPSGRIHVGSLRGVIIHDLVYKALLSTGKKATFTYVFDDQDPMDGLPVYLEEKIWRKYLGQPLFTIPSPDGKAESYAKYFAQEFIDTFRKVGSFPRLIWSSELYKSGRMNEHIKVSLDNAAVIRNIYEDLYKKKMQPDWFPFQVVCPQCGKESTTRITGWNGREVTFTCDEDAVEWTTGCGFSGKMSPLSGDGKYVGKLSWKVEWPVKWNVIGVTVEGAGKDHMSAGGSHDVAKQVCERILKYPVPYAIPYEFFLIGGKKMSSSKGIGSSAKEASDILPPYLLRFLFTRTDYNQAIDFDPVGTMVIPDLFDEYDRCYQAYVTGSDTDLARAFELSQIEKSPEKKPVFLPRFRDVANYIQQPAVNLKKKFEEIKESALTSEEEQILKEREQYARIWIGRYAPPDYKLQMTDTLPATVVDLSEKQRLFLKKTAQLLDTETAAEKLQESLYGLTETLDMKPEQAFTAIYTAVLGKEHGPKAAWFLLHYPKSQIIHRLTETANQTRKQPSVSEVQAASRPDLFTIDPIVTSRYPSIYVGIAIIRGVTIAKTNSELENEKAAFLSSLQSLNTETLGTYQEIISYRRLYKEMGIDWHSRRPSPEALLRRVALGKGLYTVNTCVDAYNLVVMKHRLSVGAFDADRVQFPTVLRFAAAGDDILLLGDDKRTKYTAKELAYYDQAGGYNIDFNYRDAQHTMVTEKTKNLWINVEGVFDISPLQVQQSLKESIDILLKYCGGKVEFSGIIC